MLTACSSDALAALLPSLEYNELGETESTIKSAWGSRLGLQI